MMQILALLTMERPKSFTSKDLCDEKARVLSWMTPIDHKRTIVGQYIRSADGSKPAFQDEEDVPEGSKCVTFCAAATYIENERWSGVPILLIAGKGDPHTACVHYCFTEGFQHLRNRKLKSQSIFALRPTPQSSTS